MITLDRLLRDREEWLMNRVLHYARETGFTRYTSTLFEAWRLSISGLSATITEVATPNLEPPPILADDELSSQAVARFGLLEADRHRERGISLAMFFGLLKYYRQAYLDLLHEHGSSLSDQQAAVQFLTRVFDIVETAIVVHWAGGDQDQVIFRMQQANREMTNEKNKYLTIFESIPYPVFLVNPLGVIDNMNHAAARLLDAGSVSGVHYYGVPAMTRQTVGDEAAAENEPYDLATTFPWLSDEFTQFMATRESQAVFEKRVEFNDQHAVFRVKIDQMLDVSSKFDGAVIILEDVTPLKDAEETVKTLEGFIPICSHCKKMREDDGYWSRLEEYLERRSGMLFTHSICDECVQKHYSKLID